MKFEVERFERVIDLTINDSINQMENYFTICQVLPEAFVDFMLMKIVSKRLNQIKQYQFLSDLEFCKKQVKIFDDLVMETEYLNALSSLSQSLEKSISDYMNRARLRIKSH